MVQVLLSAIFKQFCGTNQSKILNSKSGGSSCRALLKKNISGEAHTTKKHTPKKHTPHLHTKVQLRDFTKDKRPQKTHPKNRHTQKNTHPTNKNQKNTYSMDTQQHYSFVTHSYGKTHRKNSHTQKKSFICDMIYMTHSYGKIHTQKTHTPTKNTLHGHATPLYIHMNGSYHTYKYGVATISRLLKIIGLFCRIPSL